MSTLLSGVLDQKEKTTVLSFFINCFQSLEETMVRQVSERPERPGCLSGEALATEE